MSDYSQNAWKYYEYGRAYNNSLRPNQYRLVETNTEFFAGNQWINMPDNEAMRRLAKPTFNIIKRVTSMFVANLTSSGTTINFEPLAGQADYAVGGIGSAGAAGAYGAGLAGGNVGGVNAAGLPVGGAVGGTGTGQSNGDAAAFATAEVRNLLEKFKMDFRIRDALFDGAITGDYCAHFFWNPEARPYGGAFGEYKGEIEMELIDGINVMFGNPNIYNVEKQPYIIIVGRDTVENLKREAEYWAEKKAREAELARMEAMRAVNAVAGSAGTGAVLAEAPGMNAYAFNAAGASSGMTVESFNAGVSGNDGIGPMRELEAMRREQRLDSDGKPKLDGAVAPDSDWGTSPGAGQRIEIHGDDDKSSKATYVYMYTKEKHMVPVVGADGIPLGTDGLPLYVRDTSAVYCGFPQDMIKGISDREVNGRTSTSCGFPQDGIKGISDGDVSGRTSVFCGFPQNIVGWTVRAGVRPMLREETTVHVTKATRSCTIFEDIDTGMNRYPVAWGNWQHQKNQYHGRALVTEVIPNQIFINQMMAMVFRHLQTQAFPTKVYNADLLPNISNEVGTAIGVRNMMPGQTLGSVISTLPASDMSNQIISAIELCMQYTKECLGATDAQLGNLDATNTSALMVLQNASEVPLENTRAGLNEWVEDIGGILLDMMGTYYGLRPVQRVIDIEEPVLGTDGQQLIDPMTGQPAFNRYSKTVLQDYDFSKFKRLWFNISVDVGATTYYSEIAMVQTLDNLRREGTLDILDYLERIPDKLISKKQDLIEKIKKKEGIVDVTNGTGAMAQAAGAGLSGAAAAMAMGIGQTGSAAAADLKDLKGKNESGGSRQASGAVSHAMGSGLDAAKRVQSLPSSIQSRYESLPATARNALQKV